MVEYLTRRNTVLATIQAGRRTIHTLWIQDDINRKTISDILAEASQRNIKVRRASKQDISNKVDDGRHQGVLLEVDPFVYAGLDEIIGLAAGRGEKPLLLVLDLLHGPQNIGSLLRTAEICGIHGVIMQDRRAPDITPAVVQYSAGAAEHLLICQVTNLAQTLDVLKGQDIWIAGLDIDAAATAFNELDLDLPLAIVVGHEGDGLRRLIRKRCDFILKLPMRGYTESLNAAVAGSIMLYAAWQARGFTTNQMERS